MKVYVLVKQGIENEFRRVMGVYDTIEQVRARVDRIAKANSQYVLRTFKPDTSWSIGPDEDEGFFGNQRVYLSCVEAEYHPAVPDE